MDKTTDKRGQLSSILASTKQASLWIVMLGLMLASSGLDGVYMAKWMPPAWAWSGFVLNTMADIANPVIIYWFGRIRQTARAGSKRAKLALLLLPAEAVAVGYSWLFSWRQLRIVLPAVEPDHWYWVAPLAAGFIPLLLTFVGLAQSLLAGKLDDERAPSKAQARAEPTIAEPEPVEPFVCGVCGQAFATQQAVNAHQRVHSRSNGHKEPSERTVERWLG